MSLLNEYITKGISQEKLQEELQNLITRYNAKRNTYLFVYAAAISKRIPDISLQQEDHYIISDLLRDKKVDRLDFYIETPGGNGWAAEEIVRCLRKKSNHISFVVSGEAKSAGTLMVLSGNEILMTETGSLGPVDAQVRIGRGQVSAMDYKEWMEEKQADAQTSGILNPVDATIIAQVSPGELQGVYQTLKFAEDLVKEWLPKYKFKDWETTNSRKMAVTEQMKINRAKEIVDKLTNRDEWRLHGRSIKIEDISELLKIIRVDDDEELSDIVYRIQMVCKLLFDSTPIYKIFATEDNKILKTAVKASPKKPNIPKDTSVVELEIDCPDCKKKYKFYLKFINENKIDEDMKDRNINKFPVAGVFKCVNCGCEINLNSLKDNLEKKLGKKAIVEEV